MVIWPFMSASPPRQAETVALPRAMFVMVRISSIVTERSWLQSPTQGSGVAVGLAVGDVDAVLVAVAVGVGVALKVAAAVFVNVGVRLAVAVGVAVPLRVGV